MALQIRLSASFAGGKHIHWGYQHRGRTSSRGPQEYAIVLQNLSQEEANVPPAVSLAAEEGASQAATCLLAQLLEEQLRALDGEPEEKGEEDTAVAGWGDMLAEGNEEQVQSEGLREGMKRGAEIRAQYCEYYLASERRLCKAYLGSASQGAATST